MDPDPAKRGAGFGGCRAVCGRAGGGTARLPARREVEPRFSRALSPGGSHVSSSPALPDGGRGRGAEAESPVVWRTKRRREGGRQKLGPG